MSAPRTAASRRLETIPNAADYLGVSSKTIRRRIADGTITGFRSGPRLLRVDLNEVEERLLQAIPTAAGGQRAAS